MNLRYASVLIQSPAVRQTNPQVGYHILLCTQLENIRHTVRSKILFCLYDIGKHFQMILNSRKLQINLPLRLLRLLIQSTQAEIYGIGPQKP